MKRVVKWLHVLIKAELGNDGHNKCGMPIKKASVKSKAAEANFLTRYTASGLTLCAFESVVSICVRSRLYIVAGEPFKEGDRYLRAFAAKDITSLKHLPHLTADQWLMLAQWFVLALQDGHGVLTPHATVVRTNGHVVVLRPCCGPHYWLTALC